MAASNSVYLRALRPSDADGTWLRWLRDPQVLRWIRPGQPADLGGLRSLLLRWKADPDIRACAICVRPSGRRIGNLKLERNGSRVELGLIIGSRRDRGRGCGREAIRLGARRAQRLWPGLPVVAGIDAENTASILAFRAAGFQFRVRSVWACWPEAQA